VHTDAGSARLARAFNARAFAAGSDIVFGEGEYSPATTSGRRLLAHELAHVVASPGGAVGLMHRSLDREVDPDLMGSGSGASAFRAAIESSAGLLGIQRDPDDDDDDDDDDDPSHDVNDTLYSKILGLAEQYDKASQSQGYSASDRAKFRRIY